VPELISNEKKRKKIKPVGFIIGLKNLYITTNNGRILVVDIKTGKTNLVVKVDNDKISRPFINNKYLFLASEDSIIKLN